MKPASAKNSLPGALRIKFGGREIDLLPERAVWWPERKTLLVADVHFGKSTAFRARGVPVPAGGTGRDLDRLTRLFSATGAERLIVLGDLLHARLGVDEDLVQEIVRWRGEHARKRIMLVRGNHDRGAGKIPAEWNIEEPAEPVEEDGFCFVHAPPGTRRGPTFAGHVHPVARLRDFDGTTARAPCFVCEEDCLILPAFGNFTGGHPVEGEAGRRLYIVTATRVVGGG